MNALDYPFWLASRAAGVVAYVLLSLSVAGGLVMAMRLAPVALRTALRQAHERIALLALAFVAAHGLLLLGDTYLKASLIDVLVPFQLDYRPLATGLGILAGYGTAALALTFYVRKRLGSKRWRKAHRFIPVFWAMAAVHVLGAGTDAWSLWLMLPTFVTIAAGLWLLAERWIRPRSGPPASKRRTPAPERERVAA